MAAACGATGDVKNNLMKLLREVQRMKLRVEPDIQGLSLGAPSSLLPILHHSLMHYSHPLASWLAKHDYELYGKNDLRFVEGVYKVLREVFHYHPRLTKEQFLTVGYAERKLLLVTDLLKSCQTKHISLTETQRITKRGRRNRGSVSTKGAASEVLTVQTTSGISSAWTEPLVAQVQGAREEGLAFLSSPDHSPPPHPITPTLELTPSPPHSPPLLLLSHSSPNSPHPPESHISQPVVVRHDTPTTKREPTLYEGVLDRENLPPGGPLDVENVSCDPGEKLVIENLTSSSSDCDLDRGGAGEQKLEPPGGPPGGAGEQNLEHPPVQDNEEEEYISPGHEGGLVEVNERVKQLAKMIERMSARLVLVETQLKTVHGAAHRERGEKTVHRAAHQERGEKTVHGAAHRERGEKTVHGAAHRERGEKTVHGAAHRERGEKTVHGAAHRERGEKTVHGAAHRERGEKTPTTEGGVNSQLEGEQQERMEGSSVEMSPLTKGDVPPISTVSKATTVSIVAESSSSVARAALQNISSPTYTNTDTRCAAVTQFTRNTLTSTPHSKHPLTTHTLTPLSKHPLTIHTLTPYSKHPLTTHMLTPHSKHPLTTLTPHSKHPLTTAVRVRGSSGVLASQIARTRAAEEQSPLSSTPMTPSHPVTLTPHVLDSSLTSSPSLPNDTQLLIASLRDRAQKTKDFLQKANNRP